MRATGGNIRKTDKHVAILCAGVFIQNSQTRTVLNCFSA